LSEQKHISKPEEVKKTNSGNALKEVSTSSQEATYGVAPGEMAFSSLQSTADRSSRSNGITQLQEKANQSKGIFQLQAKADSRSTRVTEPIQTKASDTATTQLKGDEKKSGRSFLSTIKGIFGYGDKKEEQSESKSTEKVSVGVASKVQDPQPTETPKGVKGGQVSIPNSDDPKAVEKLRSEIRDQKTKIDGCKTTDFPFILELNKTADRFDQWNLDSSTLKIIEDIKSKRKEIPDGRKKILKKNIKNDKHPFVKDYSEYLIGDFIKEEVVQVKKIVAEHGEIAVKSTELKKGDFNFDEKSTLKDLQVTLKNAQSSFAQLEKNIEQMNQLRKSAPKLAFLTNNYFYKNNPPTVASLTKELAVINSFVEHDFENWKKEKEEFKKLDEKSKAWFSAALTKEEEAKLESYKNDVFLNVSSDQISKTEIKTSLRDMSKYSSKSKGGEASSNLKNEDPSQLENLEEQIKLKEKEVKEKSSGIFGRGAANEKLELAELKAKLKEIKEKERFESLSPEEQEIELKQKEVNEKSSWIPGRGADKERLELADLKTKLNEKKEKERFEKLSLSQQTIELKQRDIKEKSSRFFGLGADKEKAQLAKLLAKEKDEEERVQYKNLKEVVYSPEENEAKEFIQKSEEILSDLDWKSLEDKEKYYDLIKYDKSSKLESLNPSSSSTNGATSLAKTNGSKGNLEEGKDLDDGNSELEANDSKYKELAKQESEFYTPIVLDLYNTFSIIADLKKIKDGKKKLDATEEAMLTKKFASVAMYGMKISDSLLNRTTLSFAHIVPGLNLLIHAATAAATFFTKLVAITSKETMSEFSKDFDDLDLKNDLVFWDDKRGALSVKEIFRKVKPTFLEEADTYLEENTEKIGDFNKKYGLKFKDNEELKTYVGEVQTRELIVKLHEINLKREVHANWNMASELAIVAGDISNMIAGGQLVAGLFYGAGGVIKLGKKAAVAVNRASNGEENAFNPFGEDGMKHKEYVVHSKQIISMYTKNIPLLSPKNEEDKKKLSVNVNVAEKVVVAAGAYPPEVYKAAGKDKKGYKAVSKLVDAMKKGRS